MFNYDPTIPVSPTIPYAYKPSTIATALKKEMFSDNIISNLIRNSMLKKEESDLKNVNLCLTSLSDIITSKQHYEINIKISKSYLDLILNLPITTIFLEVARLLLVYQ